MPQVLFSGLRNVVMKAKVEEVAIAESTPKVNQPIREADLQMRWRVEGGASGRAGVARATAADFEDIAEGAVAVGPVGESLDSAMT